MPDKSDHHISHLKQRLLLLESVTEPRLKSLLTMKATLFAFRQWLDIKKGRREGHDVYIQRILSGAAGNGESVTDGKRREERWDGEATTSPPKQRTSPDFGIALFGHTRSRLIENTLESLARQDAVHFVHLFLDGDQGKPALKQRIDEVERIAERYPVKEIYRQRGSSGFRKLMLLAGKAMASRYERLLFLEDDCFPSRRAIDEFEQSFSRLDAEPALFSTYGHHFKCPGEEAVFGRFQGWGWATTRPKFVPIWEKLRTCYLMMEDEYLSFVNEVLTDELRERIDITPGRQPTDTLTKFFAWDETVCLLTAAENMVHAPTKTQVIFNCGVGPDSTHFQNQEAFKQPPFNLISPEDCWSHF